MASQTSPPAPPTTTSASSLPNTANPPSNTTQTTQPSNPPQPNPSARGMPHYEKIRRDLRLSLQKRQSIEEKLAKLEATLLNYEKAYLEENPAGNIVKGFEGYVKYTSGAGGGGARRKGGFSESDRVFSRSGGFGLSGLGGVGEENGSLSGGSTPARGIGNGSGSGSTSLGTNGNGVQTPSSQSHSQPQTGSGLVKEVVAAGGSNHATPGSTSSGNGKSNAGTVNKKSSTKRSAGEDSETDSVERKKIRVNFGAGGSGALARK